MLSIIKSHFHKGKTGFIVTGLFVILSVLMMIVGLSICLGIGNLYEKTRTLTNSADFAMLVDSKGVGELLKNNLNSREDIEEFGEKGCYWFNSSSEHYDDFMQFIFNGGRGNINHTNFVVNNIDNENDKFKPQIRDIVAGEGFKVYVTGDYIATTDVEIGSIAYFYYGGEKYRGYIAGIYDSMCDIYNSNVFYVDNSFYNLIAEFAKNDSDFKYDYRYDVRLKYDSESECEQKILSYINEIKALVTSYEMLNPNEEVSYSLFSKVTFVDATKSFIMILGTALIAFSDLIALIAALAIAFLVRSSVMDEVRNLGVWKSLGYTTIMLRLSYLAIYGVIAGICMLVGIILGTSLMPTFVNVVTAMARLDCTKAIGFNVGSLFVAIALIALVIAAVVMLATNKIKKITPLSAMRNNFETHSFKKNLVPLEKSKVPVNGTIGIKSVVGESGRSVMVVVVVLIMSFLCAFTSVAFYNLKVDQTAIINMSAIEVPDWYINYDYEDNEPLFNAIRQMDGYQYDTMSVAGTGGYCNDKYVMGYYYEDFDKLRTKMVYEGRNPKYQNEILWRVDSAKEMGLDIGDSVTITFYNEKEVIEKQCVIVGYYQSIVNQGSFMGLFDLISFYFDEEYLSKWSRYFYFEEGKVPTAVEINRHIMTTLNIDDIKHKGFMQGIDMVKSRFLNTIETAADAVMALFISVTAIVITLLLVMLIRLKILRERRNYAICKAIGYTTPNIMTQIAVAMVILSVIGSVVGAIIGGLVTTPMLSLVGGIIGIGKFAFIIPWGYIVGIFFGIPLLTYLVSMLCAVPVRKIAPATLLRERG